MACDYVKIDKKAVMKEEAKKKAKKREEQMKKLEEELKEMSARVVRNGDEVSIEGWSDREGWCDSCAIVRLKQSEDFEIRTMVNNIVPSTVGISFGHGH